MKKAYIVRKEYNGKEALVCYLSYENYKENSMAWALYDIGKNKVIEALTKEILKLQMYGYEIVFKNELDFEDEM